MEHLRCVVERITYQNADNGYTVLKCAVKNYSDLVTVVGTMPDTHVGSVLSLEGMCTAVAIDSLLALGHTSGADTLLGFWLGQQLLQGKP